MFNRIGAHLLTKKSLAKLIKKALKLTCVVIPPLLVFSIYTFDYVSCVGMGGKVVAAKLQIEAFRDMLREYKAQCGQYPTSEQGLKALEIENQLIQKCDNYRGELDKVPLDPWDSPYIYTSDGETYEILSLGADRKRGEHQVELPFYNLNPYDSTKLFS